MLNKDFLLNLFLVLFDIITLLVLGYIYIGNISSVVGLCTLLFISFRIHYLVHNLYCLICENYKHY